MFYDAVVQHRPLPKFSEVCQVRHSGEVRRQADGDQQATNPDKRDFRLVSIGPAYKWSDVIDQHDGSYEAKIKTPEKG